MPSAKANNLPRSAMAVLREWRKEKAAKRGSKPRSRSAEEEATARLLGLSFADYKRALALQQGYNARAEPTGSAEFPLAGIENLYVHKLVREGAQIVNERGDGNCLFRAIARQALGDEGEYQQIRVMLADYYEGGAEKAPPEAIEQFFVESGETLKDDYLDDWRRSKTFDKLRADQKKRIDEVLEKMKPFPGGIKPGMSTADKDAYLALAKELRDIYQEGLPNIPFDTLEQKRAFLRVYAARVRDGSPGSAFWGGEVDIKSLGQILNQDMIVYPHDNTLMYTYIVSPDNPTPNQILLLFTGRNHYKSILPPEGEAFTEWLERLIQEGIFLGDLREYGVSEGDVRNFLRGKGESSDAYQRLYNSYMTTGRFTAREAQRYARAALAAAQKMPPTDVDPQPPATPVPRHGRRFRASPPGSGASRGPGSGAGPRSLPGSAGRSGPGSRRGSATLATLQGAAAALSRLPAQPLSPAGTPRAGTALPPPPPPPPAAQSRRRQPPPTVFGVPSVFHQAPLPSPSQRWANPLLTRRRPNAKVPPAAPAPAPKKPGFFQRFRQAFGRTRRVAPQATQEPTRVAPGIRQVIAQLPQVPPPPVPPQPRSLAQRAANARLQKLLTEQRIKQAANYLKAQRGVRPSLRNQPVPGVRRGGRRTLRQKIGKGKRTRRI